MNPWRVLIVVAILGASGVGLGAFGAHGLPKQLETQGVASEIAARRINQLETGIRYQLLHTVALLAVTLWAERAGRNVPITTVALWCNGVLCFSGWLIVFALTGSTRLPLLAPLGGLSFIGGWLSLLGWSARENRATPGP